MKWEERIVKNSVGDRSNQMNNETNIKNQFQWTYLPNEKLPKFIETIFYISN